MYGSRSHPVEEYALAVCDGTTIEHQDPVETDSIRQGSISTHYYARYNEGQRWYFLHRRSPDEALILKHDDSQPGVKASCNEPVNPDIEHTSVANFGRCSSLQHQAPLRGRGRQAETKH